MGRCDRQSADAGRVEFSVNTLLRFARRPLGALVLSIAAGLVIYYVLVLVTGCVDYRSCQ